MASDPLSNNVLTLFSGFDDDGSPIENHWQDGQLNLDTDSLKIAHRMRVTDLIQKDQQVSVSLILDDGTPVQKFTIDGEGSYVAAGLNYSIGSYTLGSKGDRRRRRRDRAPLRRGFPDPYGSVSAHQCQVRSAWYSLCLHQQLRLQGHSR